MDRRLIIEHIPRLRRYARALVGDRYVADDLVQDTLERAWNKFYLWRPGSDLRAWLFTIMHNVFVNQARRRRYEIEQAMEEVPAVSVRATQSEQLEVQDVDRVLRSLSPEQRELVLLVAVEQLTYEEVSGALDIPIGTVMSRLSRARERMRQLLGGQSVMPLKVVKGSRPQRPKCRRTWTARSPTALEPRSRRGLLRILRTRSGCAPTSSKTPCSARSTTRCSTNRCRRRCLRCARARGGATPPLQRYSRSESASAGWFAGCSSTRRCCRRRSHAWLRPRTWCTRPKYAIRSR